MAAALVFFATLVIVSLFTVRLSDAILDSKIGALDRSLGFVFGAVRGFLLAVVAFAIFNWLVGDKQQPQWVQTAKTRPMLVDTADRIIALLARGRRDDARSLDQVEERAERRRRARRRNRSPDAAPPSPAPSATTGAADRDKLDALINGKVALPPPAPAPSLKR